MKESVVAHEGLRLTDNTIYEAVGGESMFLALARAWHARCLADPIVSHAFSHGFHPDHSARLAKYWAQSLGGPDDYTRSVADESFVVRLHSGNGPHREMDGPAEDCFAQALDDAGLPNDPALRLTLKEYFHWAIERMSAYPRSASEVPSNLTLPQWSWNGLSGSDAN